jgi:hypothetical protein
MSAADLHCGTRAFSEGDLRTDSCGDWESEFPADSYRDSDADLRRDSRRDLQGDFYCGLDGDIESVVRRKVWGVDLGNSDQSAGCSQCPSPKRQ